MGQRRTRRSRGRWPSPTRSWMPRSSRRSIPEWRPKASPRWRTAVKPIYSLATSSRSIRRSRSTASGTTWGAGELGPVGGQLRYIFGQYFKQLHRDFRRWYVRPCCKRGRQAYTSLFLRTMHYSLRRALSLDSVDSGTHNPTSNRRRQTANRAYPQSFTLGAQKGTAQVQGERCAE